MELIQLPPKQPMVRRPVVNPDLTTLLGDQSEGFNQITEFIKHESDEVFVLSGPAGTGKTTLLSYVLEWVLVNTTKRIAVTAPVNKAVKVSRSKAAYTSDRLDYMTTHRLLGLREVILPSGKRTFKPQFGVESKIADYDVIVVDECSMVGEELEVELFDQVYHKKLIFVGDHRQLPPVGEKISPIFDKFLTGQFKGFVLNQVLRQAEGSPIIRLSQNILKDGRYLDYGYDDEITEAGIGFKILADSAEYRQLVLDHFISPQYDADPDYCKVVVWTNDAADRVNQFVRKARYGSACPQFMPGERLITKQPVLDSEGNIMYHTNDELEVIEATQSTYKLSDNIVFDCWSLKVQEIDNLGNKYSPRYITTIADSSKDRLNNILEVISTKAKAEKNHAEKVNLWREYYGLKQKFADITYNSAITCHRAQGSTYTNCFVLYTDMSRNPNKSERKSMIYTAVTRASHRLFIYG